MPRPALVLTGGPAVGKTSTARRIARSRASCALARNSLDKSFEVVMADVRLAVDHLDAHQQAVEVGTLWAAHQR